MEIQAGVTLETFTELFEAMQTQELLAIMIEDQKWPKKCGHTKGKDVVELDEAKSRIKAAADASIINGEKDILVMARTDAIATRVCPMQSNECKHIKSLEQIYFLLKQLNLKKI